MSPKSFNDLDPAAPNVLNVTVSAAHERRRRQNLSATGSDPRKRNRANELTLTGGRVRARDTRVASSLELFNAIRLRGRLNLLQCDLDFFEPCGAGDAAECLPLLLLLLAETANRYASLLAI
uniref:Uncharacterized protein n=1 Tax=Anopheles merus TaxID=30066 RepID=A0A182V6Q7_ANOME